MGKRTDSVLGSRGVKLPNGLQVLGDTHVRTWIAVWILMGKAAQPREPALVLGAPLWSAQKEPLTPPGAVAWRSSTSAQGTAHVV